MFFPPPIRLRFIGGITLNHNIFFSKVNNPTRDKSTYPTNSAEEDRRLLCIRADIDRSPHEGKNPPKKISKIIT